MIAAPVIREAAAADLDSIMELEVAGFVAGGWSAAGWQGELAAPDRVVLVAADGSGLLGVITVRCSDVAELNRIVVAPRARRRGVARALLAAAGDRLPAGECWLEVAQDNAAALGFYRAEGFVEVGRRPRYYPGGVAAVIMKREVGR